MTRPAKETENPPPVMPGGGDSKFASDRHHSDSAASVRDIITDKEKSVKPSAGSILHHLHIARLSVYRSKCDGSDEATLDLYLWNLELSAAVHQVLAFTEVVLRNAIDGSLRAWNAAEPPNTVDGAIVNYTGDWLLEPAAPLSKLTEKTRSEANKWAGRARQKRKPNHTRFRAPVDHNDLLVQVSLGAWNNLLPIKSPKADTYHPRKYLWENAIINAFPNLSNDPNGLGTAARVGNLLDLRNRVSHMEPLLDVPIDQLYNDVLQLLDSIDPALKSWMKRYSRMVSVYRQRP